MTPTLHEILCAVRRRMREAHNSRQYLAMGICWHVGNLFDIAGDAERRDVHAHAVERSKLALELRHLFIGWEHFSGDSSFPVPVPTEEKYGFSDPESMFQNTQDVWDNTTEYGRLRRELLDYLIERTKS